MCGAFPKPKLWNLASLNVLFQMSSRCAKLQSFSFLAVEICSPLCLKFRGHVVWVTLRDAVFLEPSVSIAGGYLALGFIRF